MAIALVYGQLELVLLSFYDNNGRLVLVKLASDTILNCRFVRSQTSTQAEVILHHVLDLFQY
jgi:hypothetical protein